MAYLNGQQIYSFDQIEFAPNRVGYEFKLQPSHMDEPIACDICFDRVLSELDTFFETIFDNRTIWGRDGLGPDIIKFHGMDISEERYLKIMGVCKKLREKQHAKFNERVEYRASLTGERTPPGFRSDEWSKFVYYPLTLKFSHCTGYVADPKNLKDVLVNGFESNYELSVDDFWLEIEHSADRDDAKEFVGEFLRGAQFSKWRFRSNWPVESRFVPRLVIRFGMGLRCLDFRHCSIRCGLFDKTGSYCLVDQPGSRPTIKSYLENYTYSRSVLENVFLVDYYRRESSELDLMKALLNNPLFDPNLFVYALQRFSLGDVEDFLAKPKRQK